LAFISAAKESGVNQWNKYEPTAARKHGKLGRESRPKSITGTVARFCRENFGFMLAGSVLTETVFA